MSRKTVRVPGGTKGRFPSSSSLQLEQRLPTGAKQPPSAQSATKSVATNIARSLADLAEKLRRAAKTPNIVSHHAMRAAGRAPGCTTRCDTINSGALRAPARTC
jgi:hypothetical protein